MIFNELRKHRKLAFRRHPMRERNRTARLLGWILEGLWALYLVFLGSTFAAEFTDMVPTWEPYLVMNAYVLPCLLVLDFLLRFPLQKTPTQEVKPYLLLPVKKSRLIDSLLLQSACSSFNLCWLFLIVPFSYLTLLPSAGIGSCLTYFAGIWLLFLTNNYLHLLCRTLINERTRWVLLPLVLYGGMTCLLFLPSENPIFSSESLVVSSDSLVVSSENPIFSTSNPVICFFLHLGNGFIQGDFLTFIGTVLALMLLVGINRSVMNRAVYHELARTDSSSSFRSSAAFRSFAALRSGSVVRLFEHFGKTGKAFRESGNKVKESGKHFKESGNKVKESGKPFEEPGNKVKESGKPFEEPGNKVKESGKPFEEPERFFKETNLYLQLELKMLLRCRSCRSALRSVVLLITLFSAALGFSGIYDTPFMTTFICVYNFSAFGLIFLPKVLSFEGNYIDGLWTHRASIQSLLKAKYYLYSLGELIPLTLMIPSLLTGKVSLLTVCTWFFYTTGVVYFQLFQLAVYNRQTLPLHEKLTSRQGSSGMQIVIKLAVFGLPLLLYTTLETLWGTTLTNLMFLTAGLAFTLASPRWLNQVCRRFLQRKYENFEGFRESRQK